MSSNLFVVLNSNSNLLTLCRCAYFAEISVFLSFLKKKKKKCAQRYSGIHHQLNYYRDYMLTDFII